MSDGIELALITDMVDTAVEGFGEGTSRGKNLKMPTTLLYQFNTYYVKSVQILRITYLYLSPHPIIQPIQRAKHT